MTGRGIDALLILCVAGIVAVLAGSSLRSVAGAGEAVAIASTIRHGLSVEPEWIAALAPMVRDGARRPCDDRADRAILTVALRDLANRNPATDYDAWSASADRAGAFLRRLVGCSPLDGRRWAQLGLVERVQVAPLSQIASHVRFSEKVSPVDIDIARKRLEVWRTAPAPLREAIRDVALRDMDRIVERAYGADVRAVMTSMQPSFDDWIAARLPGLAPPRRELILGAQRDLKKQTEKAPRVLYELPSRPPR